MSDASGTHDVARRRIGHASTLLLALATVATAWAGYQAARWHGKQAIAQAAATAARVDASRLAGVGGRKGQVDVAVFIQWVDARAQSDTPLATLLPAQVQRAPAAGVPGMDPGRPFDNATAALTPFELPQYVIPEVAPGGRARGEGQGIRRGRARRHPARRRLRPVRRAARLRAVLRRAQHAIADAAFRGHDPRARLGRPARNDDLHGDAADHRRDLERVRRSA